MRYAEVSVNSPIARRRTFSYGIPAGLNVIIGQAVHVPFGEKTLQGIVVELTSHPSVEETRDIAGIIDPAPLLSPARISLARWLSDHYLAPLFESIALMLPPGFERRVVTFISRSPDPPEMPSPLNPDQQAIWDYLPLADRVPQRELEKKFGVLRTRKTLTWMARGKWIVRDYELEKVRIRPKIVSFLHLKVDAGEAQEALYSLSKQAVKQVEVLRFLIEKPEGIALAEAKKKLGSPDSAIRALINKGLIEVRKKRVDRDPLPIRSINLSLPLPLTSDQEAAFRSICAGLRRDRHSPGFAHSHPEVFLLHGVTGSGKTEIYLRALEEVVKQGKRGIVLVPEIAMTPQIIERFVSRFPGRVALLHSELSPGEQFDEWWRIKNGEFDVVIGPRSAVFAPQPDLGLIIIDEEHEWTYKQQDNTPRYHTRRAAVKLAELTGAVVVLGSATPDVESYYHALNGEYRLLELPGRVTPAEDSPLPQVEIVDLRTELKAGNLSLFSRSLRDSIDFALKNREQIILFLNRRGTASFIECRNCGQVIRCKRCEVPLSYHFAEEKLVCHQCNYHIKVPQICPRCQSRRIKYLGAGTEKLEQETAEAFPQARLLRWDSDVVQGYSRVHQEIFAKLKAGEADILIGTQMVTKGLDLPRVTLVGVINADISLNLPDFRAGERAFQLLSQVAGRAGRGLKGGRVIIQTYTPEHYAVQAAAKHDYLAFYRRELDYRRELHNPPLCRLVRLVFTHHEDMQCREKAERMKQRLLEERDAKGIAGTSIIGPAPAFIHRLRGRFRWQLVLRTHNPGDLLSGITFPAGWTVDIDPIGLD